MDGQINGREICEPLTSCRQWILASSEKARVGEEKSENIISILLTLNTLTLIGIRASSWVWIDVMGCGRALPGTRINICVRNLRL